MTTWASRDAVESALTDWSDAQIACRAYQHNWRPLNVVHRPGFYTVSQRCSRCRNERTQDITEQGYVATPWRMVYREGYLLKNAGRVGIDGRAALRLATLRNLTVNEVVDEP